MTQEKCLLMDNGWELCCTGGRDSFRFHLEQYLHYLTTNKNNEYVLREYDAYILTANPDCVVTGWERRSPGWSIWKRSKIKKEEPMKKFEFGVENQKAKEKVMVTFSLVAADKRIELHASSELGDSQLLATIDSDGTMNLIGLAHGATEMLGIQQDKLTGTIKLNYR